MTTEFAQTPAARDRAVEQFPIQVDDRAAAIDHVVAEVVVQLGRKGVTPVDGGLIRELVESDWDRYNQATVRTFVPVLVRRAVVNAVLGREFGVSAV